MRTSVRPRNIAAVVFAVGSLLATACSDDHKTPTAVAPRSTIALSSRIPTAHALGIRQRVADARRRHLSATESAQAASLRGKWTWVADLHHTAMQEAIHDPSLHGLRQPHTAQERCDVAKRYLNKYSPAIDARSGRQRRSDAERSAANDRLAAEIGICPPNPVQASIFAVAVPRFTIAHTVRASARAGGIDLNEVLATYRDYLIPMAADLRQATDLGDANDIMDAYLATATADPGVSPTSLALIAGTVDLASSSALEWDTFARPHEASMFMWGWLSGIGDWIVNTFSADLDGCFESSSSAIGVMADVGWSGSADGFLLTAAGECAGGGIISSIFTSM